MTARAGSTILYITYDGLLEPLGQSQVLSYMEKLAQEWPVRIVSFEKQKDREDKARMAAMRARLTASGIAWTPLNYHKSPSVPATAYDIAQGVVVALWLALRHKATIVHVRSYIPALMALPTKRITGAKLLFDMRGFWADERVDGGLWPKGGLLYRLAKRLERLLLVSADHIVTLTQASAQELRRFPYLEHRTVPLSIIPTCADLARFRPQTTMTEEQFILGYVGSVGSWYLLDEILTFYLTLLEVRPDARLLFVNRNEHALIRESLERREVASDRVEIVSAEHGDVPRQIARMRVAAAIIKPCFSKIASAPTKFAEYLGCGVPCVGNIGVGDMEEILEGKRVGVALHDFSHADHKRAVTRLLALCSEADLRNRCVATARELFSTEKGVDAYRQIYTKLSGMPDTPQSRRKLDFVKSKSSR